MAGINAEEASMRGHAVEMFARLERELDSVISHYYTPKHPLSSLLFFDLLMSESFSFSLRRDAFECIVRRHDWYDDKRMQQLRKAGRWRNFLAHVAGMEHHDYNDEDNPKIGYRDPKHPHEVLTVAQAFDKFKEASESAEAWIIEVSHKITPQHKDGHYGHVVLEPVAPEDTYEAWLNRPLFGGRG